MSDNNPYAVPPEMMQQLSDEFTHLCVTRHETGAEQYGGYAYLKNDMIRFIAEELADAANYMRYLYMKIRLLEEGMNHAGSTDLSNLLARPDSEPAVPHGFASSADASTVLRVLPDRDGPVDPG